jgi:hypothetical protein
MSPRKKPVEPTEVTVLSVRVASLARLLDLPAGVEVVDVRILAGGALTLTLTGVDTDQDRTDAEWSVDAHGRRSFVRFKPPAGDSAGINPDPTEEEE